MSSLFNKQFFYLLPLDENRSIDGVDLRREYIYENNLSEDGFVKVFPSERANLLEVILSLAIRCDQIMSTSNHPSTYFWFGKILKNIGINECTDDFYNSDFVESRLDDLIWRRYRPDGFGGFFYIRNAKEDLRNVDIGTQMSWYLNQFDNEHVERKI